MRLLDLYCCAGGAGVGYARAGFAITGVDIVPRPNYPLPFAKADAIEYVKAWGHKYDAIHASPPCQFHSAATKGTNTAIGVTNGHVDLIPATRDALNATGLPWIIENVAGAPIRHDLVLHGPHFDLGVVQRRYFELGNWTVQQPVLKPQQGRVRGWRHGLWIEGPYVQVHGKGGGKATVREAQIAKGIDWTDDWVELCEAIPPAYTEWIGKRLLEFLDSKTV
jgi:hypothetical protein